MAQLILMKDIQVEDAERCTLTSSSVPINKDQHESPTRARLPRLAKPQQGFSHWTPAFAVPQVHLSDFCVPMLSLIAPVLDGLRQVRRGPEMV